MDYQDFPPRCQVPAMSQLDCAAAGAHLRFLQGALSHKLSANRSQLLTHKHCRIAVEFRYEISPTSFPFREVPKSATSEAAESVFHLVYTKANI